MYLKTGRLSKAPIKSHIMKRYKKIITDKVMARVDDYLKDRNTFDFMVYLQMLWSILIEKETFKIDQNKSIEIPGLFRFCFDIFDMGDKEFICEHDIF